MTKVSGKKGLFEMERESIADFILLSYRNSDISLHLRQKMRSCLIELIDIVSFTSEFQYSEGKYNQVKFRSSSKQGYILDAGKERLVFFDQQHDRIMSIEEYFPNIWLQYQNQTHDFAGIYSFHREDLLRGLSWTCEEELLTNKITSHEIIIELTRES